MKVCLQSRGVRCGSVRVAAGESGGGLSIPVTRVSYIGRGGWVEEGG